MFKEKNREKNDLRFNNIKKLKVKKWPQSPLGTINIELMSNLSDFSKLKFDYRQKHKRKLRKN